MSWPGGKHGRGSRVSERQGLYGHISDLRGSVQNRHTAEAFQGISPRIVEELGIHDPSHRSSPDEIMQRHKDHPSSVSSLKGKASGFARRLFSATSIMEDQNHPDDLLNEIPEHTQAVAELKNNDSSRPPVRDLPSPLISILAGPKPGPHPNWRFILAKHVSSPHAKQPLSNLQDLYLWVVRVGIPNAIIDNRRFMLHFYMHNRHAPKYCRLRYDNQPPRSYYVPLGRETQAHPPYTVPRHSVFQNYDTPRGERFMQWLAHPIHVPAPNEAPWQLDHVESVLNGFLVEEEDEIRQVEAKALLGRTEGVLKMLWWIWLRNRDLAVRQDAGWKGMEETMG